MYFIKLLTISTSYYPYIPIGDKGNIRKPIKGETLPIDLSKARLQLKVIIINNFRNLLAQPLLQLLISAPRILFHTAMGMIQRNNSQ